MGFLQRFGYLESRQDTNSEALIREEAVIDAVRTMQRFGGISPTGQMDNDTLQVSNNPFSNNQSNCYESNCPVGRYIKLLVTPRCGNKDVDLDNDERSESHRRRKRFVIGAPGWNKRRITYLSVSFVSRRLAC